MDNNLSERVDILKAALNSSFNHIVITDTDGNIVFANPAVTKITGYTPDEIIGKTPKLWGGQMPKEFYINMWHKIKDLKEPFQGEITNKRKNGEIYKAFVFITPLIDKDNNLIGFIGTEEDISKYIKVENALEEEKESSEKFNRFVVDREVRMRELKQEIEELKQKLINI